MKKAILTLVVAVAAITGSYAQADKRAKVTPEQRAERSTALMEEKLKLTPEQKKKVYALEVDRIKKAEEWRKEDLASREDKKKRRTSFMRESKSKMVKVLTPEQQQSLTALRKEKSQEIKKHDKRGSRKDHRKPVRQKRDPLTN